MVTQQQHIAATRLAVAIIDANSPSEAKAIAERFQRQTWNAAIEACAELADSSLRVTGTQIRKLLK